MKLLDDIIKLDNGSKFWKCDLHIHTPASYDFPEKMIYLFSWDEIPGNDNERLINFLNQNFGIEWVKTAEIEKIDDDWTIRVSTNDNFISLKLNDVKNKVNLEIDDGRTDEIIVKSGNGKLNIYRKTTPKDIVESALAKGLKLIAITDHNTGKGCEEIIKVAKETDLYVLPGVEITCSDGKKNIHIIAIFPENKIESIQDLLSKINIIVSEQKNPTADTHSTENVLSVLNEIKELVGMAIAPHADSENGIASGKEGKPRIDIIKHPALMAVETNKEKTRRVLDGTDLVYNRKLACIRSSDNTTLDEIGSKSTFIKLGTLDFEGLRQAFLDPDSRIKEIEESTNYPLVIGMSFQGGFLDKHKVHFNKNLNCLIGSRGTGKSTIIELLRYALIDSPDTKFLKIEAQRQSLIKYTLGDGGKVTAYVKNSDGQIYKIERALDDETKILDNKGNQIQVSINDLFKIEAYSQEEVVEIAKKPSIQLDMIDNLADIKDSLIKKENIKKKLKNNARELIGEIFQVEEWSIDVAQLSLIKHQLEVLDERGLKDRLKNQRMWENDKRIIQKISTEIEKEIARCENRHSEDSVEVPEIDDEFACPEIINLSQKELLEAKQKQKDLKVKELEIWKNVKNNFENRLIQWIENYEDQKETYRKLLNQLQKEGIQEPSNYLKLENQKKELELLAKKIEEKRKSIEKYEGERTKLLDSLIQIRGNIFTERQGIAKDITKKTDNFIQVNIEHEKDRELYETFLIDMLYGSGIRDTVKNPNKKRIASIHPIVLVKLVRNGQSKELAEQASVAKNIAEKVINHLKNKESLFDLEIQDLNDSPEIKLKMDDGLYKSIIKLSPGQKCTAILSIAMLNKNKPLIVDQPEDAIDNSFIKKQIVEGLRAIKNGRQIILATHNANIPVLGDAELITVMSAEENIGNIVCCGAIDKQEIKDHVTTLLEGGKEAFTKRLEKYGF